MLQRLLFGLLKGLGLGLGVGVIVHFGLGWTVTGGLAGYLLAMGTGATAGVLAGRPPWKRAAWLEGVLKAVVGLGLGLLLFWLADRFASGALPFGLLGAPEGAPWNHLPLLYAPIIATLYGVLVEIDNTPEIPKPGRSGPPDAEAPTIASDSETWEP